MVSKKKDDSAEVTVFEKEISRLPDEYKKRLLKHESLISEFVDVVKKKTDGKSMGFYLNPLVEVKNNVPTPNFEKLTVNFLLDDFERPIPNFDVKILLGGDFDKFLEEVKVKDEYGQEEVEYVFKKNKNVKFKGSSISLLRENCFDGIYDDLKNLGTCFIYEDSRGFLGALKTIDIHRNMLLQKFEKYIVVYAGAGSWLRGEKSNDFDVFIVVDDTDVKKMPRAQVKEQLTRIIWQMIHEVAQITGIQLHAQVYLLTDFWDALKDAHPVMFTFLRDGVPFYDRGLYSAWKELLKLGKIRPSPEAIDMHMNVGTQLLDRASKMFNEIFMNDIYNAVLSPSQAILMLKGYNPTTPKETVKMFKEVLYAKEKSISKKDVDVLEKTVLMFKKIEHDKKVQIKGSEIDKYIKDADEFLKNIKKMFEEISAERTKESVIFSYNELINQIKTLPGMTLEKDLELLKKFEKEYVLTGVLPSFIKDSLKGFLKAKQDYDKGKITVTEVNKVLKEVRNIMSEIKNYRESSMLTELSKRKFFFNYGKDGTAELINFDGKVYLLDLSEEKLFEMKKDKFVKSNFDKEKFLDSSKVNSLKISEDLLGKVKSVLGVDEIYL